MIEAAILVAIVVALSAYSLVKLVPRNPLGWILGRPQEESAPEFPEPVAFKERRDLWLPGPRDHMPTLAERDEISRIALEAFKMDQDPRINYWPDPGTHH